MLRKIKVFIDMLNIYQMWFMDRRYVFIKK